MNLPLGNLKIFPYFGGDIDSKEVSEQNLSASLRNLNLYNNGNKYFDTSNPTSEIQPFRILYPYATFASTNLHKAYLELDTSVTPNEYHLKFAMRKGSGMIYGYNVEIEPDSDSTGVVMDVNIGTDKPVVGGTLYLKLNILNDSNRLRTATDSTSAFEVLYVNSWTNLSLEERKRCLRIYQASIIPSTVPGTITFAYICNLGVTEGFECIDSSKYKINIDTNGITLYKYYIKAGDTDYTKAGLFLKDKDNTSDLLSVGLITNNITEKIDFSTLRQLNSNYMASLTLDNTSDTNALAKMLLKIEKRDSFISLDKDKIKLQNTNSDDKTTSGITIADDSTTIEYTKQNKSSYGGSFTLNSVNTRMAKWFDDEMKTYAHLRLGGSTSSDATRLELLSKTATRTNFVDFTDAGISLKSYLNSQTDRSNELNFNNNYTELIKYISTSGEDKYHSTLRVGTLDNDKRVQLAWQGAQRFSELFFNTSLISMYSKASNYITGIVLKDNIIQLYSTNSGATPANSESYLAFDLNSFTVKKRAANLTDLDTTFKVTSQTSQFLGMIQSTAEKKVNGTLGVDGDIYYKDTCTVGGSSSKSLFETTANCVFHRGSSKEKNEKFEATLESGINGCWGKTSTGYQFPKTRLYSHTNHYTSTGVVSKSTTWTKDAEYENYISCNYDNCFLSSSNTTSDSRKYCGVSVNPEETYLSAYSSSTGKETYVAVTQEGIAVNANKLEYSIQTPSKTAGYGKYSSIFKLYPTTDSKLPNATEIAYTDYNNDDNLFRYVRILLSSPDIALSGSNTGGVCIDLNAKNEAGNILKRGNFWVHYWTGSATAPKEHWIDVVSKLNKVTTLEEENEQLKNQINSLQEKLLMIEERLNNLS